MMSKYNTKKIKNQGVYKLVDKHLPTISKKRFCECGNWMENLADDEVAKMKVHKANFCKNRFCPICAWRLAEKDAMKISVLMDYIKAEHEKDFIFVTLTAPNVRAGELKQEIDRYNDAFKKLCKRDEVEKINRGYIRKMEISYNSEPKITCDMWHGYGRYIGRPMGEYFERKGLRIGDENPNYNTYHTHFHVVFAVNKSYFKKADYINQERWLELWRGVMKDDSITQVDVRRVKVADRRDKAVNEIAKYAAKDEDYTKSQEIFDVFYEALKGRQVLTYNGLFAEANKKYKNKELEEYKTRDETKYVWLILYQWGSVEYIEKRRREVSEEEYKELKKDSEDEMAIG